jgi:hypothetical protein
MQSTAFKLDDEHRSRMKDCLRKDKISLGHDAQLELTRKIELSISTFLKVKGKAEGTLREAHEALRQLWFLAHEDDCPVGQLRARLNRLPGKAVEYLDMRAERVIPRLFPGENADHGYLAWAKRAHGAKLIRATCVVSADGGQRVARSRGPGKRSRPRREPLIFGQVRGAGGGSLRGGRPRHDAQDALVMHLAIDWNIVTNAGPAAGRSDYRGFGDLVHSVFQWLDEPSAEQALRRFWEGVEKGRSMLQEGSKPPA